MKTFKDTNPLDSLRNFHRLLIENDRKNEEARIALKKRARQEIAWIKADVLKNLKMHARELSSHGIFEKKLIEDTGKYTKKAMDFLKRAIRKLKPRFKIMVSSNLGEALPEKEFWISWKDNSPGVGMEKD